MKGRNMRAVVKDGNSKWRDVINRVSQGSVLAPILFLYVNDITEGVSSYINLFVDDARLLKKIRNRKDCYNCCRMI